MADNTKTTKEKAAPKPKGAAQKAVTREEFEAVEGKVDVMIKGIGDLTELIKSGQLAKTPEAARAEKEVEKAGPNKFTVNPEWEDIAREIIGEPVDHTEVEYVKGGGQKFTVVIKPEFSNAAVDYLERYKADRRSKEVGQDGEAGVRLWCELIRNNLKLKPKQQAL